MDRRFRLSLLGGAVVILAALAGTIYTDPSWFLVLACLGMAAMGWASAQKAAEQGGTPLDRAASWGVLGGGVVVGLGIAAMLLFGG
jgi:uncharacterized membrane protein YidH (DUF202 family)